jgi:hypothetical protein
MTTRKEVLKGKLRAWVSAGSPSDNYGFGSNWHLNIGNKNKVVKSFWLGQGAKVTSRMLGMDYNDYTKRVIEKVGKKKGYSSEGNFLADKKVNKMITEDILHSTFGDEWISPRDYNENENLVDGEILGGWTGEINNKRLKKLLGEADWGLAVQ